MAKILFDPSQCFSNFSKHKKYQESLSQQIPGPHHQNFRFNRLRWGLRMFSNEPPGVAYSASPTTTLRVALIYAILDTDQQEKRVREGRSRFSTPQEIGIRYRKSLPKTNQCKCVWKVIVQLPKGGQYLVDIYQWPNSSALPIFISLPCNFTNCRVYFPNLWLWV